MRHLREDKASHWRISTVPLLALALGAVAVGGCGGSKSTSSSASTAAPETTASTPANTSSSVAPSSSSPGGLSLAANPQGELKYDATSLTAEQGKVTIAFTNDAPLSHNVTVESSSGSTVGATPTFQGGSKKLTLNLKPGSYKFYCSVPGHRQAGMEGTLVVK